MLNIKKEDIIWDWYQQDLELEKGKKSFQMED